MAHKMDEGLPRNEIKWFPTVNYELCIGCGICVEFCPKHVYEKQSDKAVVARPYDCVVGCESCSKRCPVGAISFPSRHELKQMLRELREKYGYR
ncbi:MAG: ferredoxin family protein [Candidatus Bathyarchaeia archaeon]